MLFLFNHGDTEGTEEKHRDPFSFLEGTEATENTEARVGGETNDKLAEFLKRPQSHREFSFIKPQRHRGHREEHRDSFSFFRGHRGGGEHRDRSWWRKERRGNEAVPPTTETQRNWFLKNTTEHRGHRERTQSFFCFSDLLFRWPENKEDGSNTVTSRRRAFVFIVPELAVVWSWRRVARRAWRRSFRAWASWPLGRLAVMQCCGIFVASDFWFSL